MSSRRVQVNGVELCVETFGDRGDPPILLIHGSGASMDWWEDEFCERLAAESRFVIRYDHRDTGQSVSYPPGAPRYTGRDLVTDAVGILEALDVTSAHIVGISMGGAFAQVIALDHPEHVSSLTLIATSFADRARSDLPGMSAESAAQFAVEQPDWSDRAAVIDYTVHLFRASAAASASFDEARVRDIAGRVFDRTADIAAAMTNHDLIDPGDPPTRRLEELTMPTLVIHGREDPLFPFEHGVALAEAIPGAELLALEAMGHELPARVWDTAIPAIAAHTTG